MRIPHDASLARFLLLLPLGVFSAAAPAVGCELDRRGTNVPADAASVVLSLQGIDCQSCGTKIVAALESTPGVHAADFDMTRAEVSIRYDAQQVQPGALVARIEALGYRATEGAGTGEYLAPLAFPTELDVRQISAAGEDVDIIEHLAPAKVTVFDFHAIWCGPCRKVDRHMLSVLQQHPDVALRKLDVVDWDSAIAKHYLRDVPGLPFVIVHGRSGTEVARISGLDLAALDRAIEDGRAQ